MIFSINIMNINCQYRQYRSRANITDLISYRIPQNPIRYCLYI